MRDPKGRRRGKLNLPGSMILSGKSIICGQSSVNAENVMVHTVTFFFLLRLKKGCVKMVEKIIMITNNSISYNYFKDKHNVIFVEGSLLDVLYKVRDYIHKGHKLLTHPLMGSVKPNETPYKTVAISENSNNSVDIQSLIFIENSIQVSQNLIKNKPPRNWPDSILKDFEVIDFDLIKNAINN